MKLVITVILMVSIALIYFVMSGSDTEQMGNNQELQLEFSADASNVKNLDPKDKYKAIIEQPLFIEEREFAEEKKVEKVIRRAPVIEDLKVQALGIALIGDGLLAVVKDLKNGKTLRMRVNEKIYGWTLKNVSESSFTFSKAGKEKVIAFKD